MSGETITNIVKKANIFNEFFASQCAFLENSRKFPSLLMNTDKRLNPVSIKKDDITSILNWLNPTKTHGFNNISICIIQLLGDSIESAKLRALRAHVPTCLACLRTHVPTCLACLRTYMPTCLTCLRTHVRTCLACLRAHVQTCLACLCTNVPCVFTCHHALRAYVLKSLACLRAHVPCVLKCSRVITSNNKNNFSMTWFT